MYFNLFIRFVGIGISLITLILLSYVLSTENFSRYAVIISLSAFFFISIDFGLCKIILKQHALNVEYGARPNLYLWLGRENLVYIVAMILLSYLVVLAFKGSYYSNYCVFLSFSLLIVNLSGEALKGQGRPLGSIIVTSLLPSFLIAVLIIVCYFLKILKTESAIIVVGSMNILSGFSGLFYSSICSKGLHLVVSKETLNSRLLISLNNASANLHDHGIILLLSALGLDKAVAFLALTSKVGLLFKSIFAIGCAQYMPSLIKAANNVDIKDVLRINKLSSKSMYKVGKLAFLPVLFYSGVLIFGRDTPAFVAVISIFFLYLGHMAYLFMGCIQGLPVLLSNRSRGLSIGVNIFIFISTSLMILILDQNIVIIHILICISIILRGTAMKKITLNELYCVR